jgi:hypothetical protein
MRAVIAAVLCLATASVAHAQTTETGGSTTTASPAARSVDPNSSTSGEPGVNPATARKNDMAPPTGSGMKGADQGN